MIFTALGHRIIVRYARKPIWMPTAPSKLFRIAEHTFYSEDEIEQIKYLHEAFKAQEKSLSEFMKHEFYIPATQSGGIPPEFMKKEKLESEQLYRENEEENARLKKLREEYFDKQKEDLKERLIDEKLNKEEYLIRTAMKVDEYVMNHKDNADYFVTKDNIEAMIEKAIENPTNFEFCIDTYGRKYERQKVTKG